jgi:hypothetical protein
VPRHIQQPFLSLFGVLFYAIIYADSWCVYKNKFEQKNRHTANWETARILEGKNTAPPTKNKVGALLK